MRRIFKYRLVAFPSLDVMVRMPVGSIVLAAGCQGPLVVIWADVDAEAAPAVVRKFHVIFTGDRRPSGTYVGTATDPNGLVYHVYDAGEMSA